MMATSKVLSDVPVAYYLIRDAIHNLTQQQYEMLLSYGFTLENADYMRDSIVDYGKTLIDVPQNSLEQAEVIFVPSRSDETIECWHVNVDLWTEEEGLSDLTLSVFAYIQISKSWLQLEDLHIL